MTDVTPHRGRFRAAWGVLLTAGVTSHGGSLMDGKLQRQVLDTEVLPPPERFGMWLDMMASTPTPLRVHTAHADDFVARAEFVELGRMRLIRYRYPSVDCVRTSKLIQRSDPDYYLLALTLTGTSQADQAGQRACCRPGDLTFYDCSRPHEVSHHADPAGPAYARSIVALMPYDALPLPRRRLAPLFAGRMSGSEGVGGLLVARRGLVGDGRLAGGLSVGLLGVGLLGGGLVHVRLGFGSVRLRRLDLLGGAVGRARGRLVRGLRHWIFTPLMMTSDTGEPSEEPSAVPASAMALTTSRPDVTWPNTV